MIINTVLALIFQTIVIIPAIKEAEMDQVYKNQQEYTSLIVNDINFSFEQALEEIESLASLDDIKSMQKAQIDGIIGLMNNLTHFFDYFCVIDPNGTWVSYPSNQSFVGNSIPLHNMGWVNKTIEQNHTIFLDVVVTLIDTLVSGYSTPIHNASGDIVGIIRGVIVTSTDNSLLRSIKNTKIGKNGYIYIVSSNGWLVAHPKVSLNVINYESYNYTIYSPVISILDGETGITEYEYNNEIFIASYTTINTTGWGIIVQQPEKDVISLVQNEINVISIFFIIVFVLSALILAFFIQFSLKPLNNLIEQIKDDKTEFLPKYRNDEIGDLANEFSYIYLELYRSRDRLLKSEQRYRKLIEESPVPLKLLNFSEIKTEFDYLKREGINDLCEYFEDNPEISIEIYKKVKVLDVNNSAISLYKAKTKKDLIKFLHSKEYYTNEKIESIIYTLCLLSKGIYSFFIESVEKTKDNKSIATNIFIKVQTGYVKTLERVLISIVDLTVVKKAEKSIKLLKSQEEQYQQMLGHFLKNDFQAIQFNLEFIKLKENISNTEVNQRIDNVLSIISGSNLKIDLINEIFNILQTTEKEVAKKFNIGNLFEKIDKKLKDKYESINFDLVIDKDLHNVEINSNLYIERAFYEVLLFIITHNEEKITIRGKQDKKEYIVEFIANKSIPIPLEVCNILKGNISDKWDSRYDFLGLSVVSVIMQYYKGKCNIIPNEMKGNTIQLIFPLKKFLFEK